MEQGMKRKTKKMNRGMIEFGADCITRTLDDEPWKVGRIHSVNKA